MMYTGLSLQLLNHPGNVPRGLQYLNTQCQRSDSVDGNTLMDRQDIGPVLCDDLQHIRQYTRFIIHLKSKSDGRSLGIVMKGKNIIFVLIKELRLIPTASTASCMVRTFSDSRSRFASTTFNSTSGIAFCFTTKYLVVSPICYPFFRFVSVVRTLVFHRGIF